MNKPSRMMSSLPRGLLILCSFSIGCFALEGRRAKSAEQDRAPVNVVMFLADDLGWTDMGCFGSPLHQTPHVDRLARQGVRFTDAYSPACSCSPSRAGIMTGRFPGHMGMTAIIEKHLGDRAPDDAPLLPAVTKPHLPHEELTIAEALKTRGYATAMVGKWHLGVNEFGPTGHGFDVAIGAPHAGFPKSYFWPQWEGNPRLEGRFDGEYLTDRLAEEACQFIEGHHQQPFFLCLSFHSVHVPIEAKAKKVTKYADILKGRSDDQLQHHNPHYAGMVESLDEGVGRVMQTLQQLELAGNTLVLFFSDNGGLVHPSHVGEHTPATSNKPLSSGKGFLKEGGIRVPLIIKWPGVAEADSICHVPVHGCDLFPTICGAAQVSVAGLETAGSIDGIDLTPLLQKPNQEIAERPLYWHYPHFSSMGGRPSGAIRLGKWKLIEHFETSRIELYDLVADIGETSDLSSERVDQAAALRRLAADWRDDVGALLPSRVNPNYQHR